MCSPVTIDAPGASASQTQAIADALTSWAAVGVSTLAVAPHGQLVIRFEAAAPAFRGYYDDEHGTVYVNELITDRAVAAVVIAHELGHAFGLSHIAIEERASVMNDGNVAVAPNAADAGELVTLWGPCQQRTTRQ